MSTHLIEYPLENGTTILVETQTSEEATARISSEGTEAAGQKFEEAVNKAEPALLAVTNLMKKLQPEEATVEVGFKFSAKAGVILASADSEATFKVTLKWKRHE